MPRRGSINLRNRTVKAVAECLLYNFTREQGLAYVKSKTEKEISLSEYYRLRKFIESEVGNNVWLNEHAQVGFVYNLRKRLDIIDLQINDLMQDILYEKSKSRTGKDVNGQPTPKRNERLLLKLRDELKTMVLAHQEIDEASPVIAKLKAMLVANEIAENRRRDNTEQLDENAIQELWSFFKAN